MQKRTIVIIAGVIILAGLLAYNLRYVDFSTFFRNSGISPQKATLYGSVKEADPFPQPVKEGKVTMGGKTVKIDKNGNYRIENVPLGLQKLTAEGPTHEKYEKEVEIRAGDNKADILLSLTADETMRRSLELQRQEKYEEAYEYLHPEEKATVSREEYASIYHKRYAEAGFKIKSFEIESPVILEKWTNPQTRKVFPKTAEMKAILTVAKMESGKTVTVLYITQKTHLVKVGNQWKGFWVRPRD